MKILIALIVVVIAGDAKMNFVSGQENSVPKKEAGKISPLNESAEGIQQDEFEAPQKYGFTPVVIEDADNLARNVGSLVTIKGKIFVNKRQTILGVHLKAAHEYHGLEGYAVGILVASKTPESPPFLLYRDLDGHLAGAKPIALRDLETGENEAESKGTGQGKRDRALGTGQVR